MSGQAVSFTSSRQRVRTVDAFRGLAVLLMVLDHVLAVVDPYSTLRVGAPWSVTRLSLPLFMLAAAAVWTPSVRWWARPSRRRLAAAAVLEVALLAALDAIGQPGILAVFALVLVLLDLSARFDWFPSWWLWAVLGFGQALYVPIGWDGYEPGLVLGWFALGVVCWREDRPTLGWLPAWSYRPVEWVGRHPLPWYVGHLLVLVVVERAL